MADQRIQYTEEMVGAGHGTKADTLNRLGLVEHNNDGTHKGAGAALTLLGTATPSGVASVDFTTGISSTYKAYLLACSGLLPATDGDYLWMRVSEDAGSTWEADGGDYSYANHQSFSNGASSGYDNLGSDIKIRLGGAGVGNLSSEGQSANIWIYNPASTSHHTMIAAQSILMDVSGDVGIVNTAARYTATTAVDGLRLLFSSGNIASGEVRLYGLRAA